MWPKTWKDTAENRPMQMNWLRLTPMAMKHKRARKNYRIRVQYCKHDVQIKTPVNKGWHLNEARVALNY